MFQKFCRQHFFWLLIVPMNDCMFLSVPLFPAVPKVRPPFAPLCVCGQSVSNCRRRRGNSSLGLYLQFRRLYISSFSNFTNIYPLCPQHINHISTLLSSLTATMTSQEQEQEEREMTITFGELTIIEFPVELGDNPAVSSGAPIRLGSQALSTTTRNLDLYEYIRKDTRRHRTRLQMSVPLRAELLFAAGYTMDQIMHATLAADEIRSSRKASVKIQGWTVGSALSFSFKKVAKQRTVPARTA
jgi:hypothetical protein